MITIPVPTRIAGKWIRSRLSTNAALTALVGDRIRPLKLAQGDSYPGVIYQCRTGMDEGCIGSPDNLMDVDLTYLIRAVTKGSALTLAEDIVDLFDGLLNNEEGNVSAGNVIYCRRGQPYEYSDTILGQDYYQLGFFYELRVQA